MLKIIIYRGHSVETTGYRKGWGRITPPHFSVPAGAYQQLPPSIPNPCGRKPNSTYQSLSTRFRKTILKGLPSKCIVARIGKQSLNYPVSRKKGKEERNKNKKIEVPTQEYERERVIEGDAGRELEPRFEKAYV